MAGKPSLGIAARGPVPWSRRRLRRRDDLQSRASGRSVGPFRVTTGGCRKGRKNGELLALAAGHFDVFLTADAGIEYQQNLGSVALGVIALKARSNRIRDLRPLMPRVRQLLETTGPGRWERVGE